MNVDDFIDELQCDISVIDDTTFYSLDGLPYKTVTPYSITWYSRIRKTSGRYSIFNPGTPREARLYFLINDSGKSTKITQARYEKFFGIATWINKILLTI